MITGESGVGKEVIAKIIHENSLRSNGPFMQLNCSAIPASLLESELFGYEQGAFTGAKSGGKKGLIEICNNGTLLLDEIGDMPYELQGKLLRVIQEQEIIRLGSVTPQKINVRFIAATNKNIEELVKNKQFRQDLFYRLNVIPIHIPPLRERKEDIVPLAQHFLKKINNKYKTKKVFHRSVLQTFEQYSWPGNVRELQNLIERLVVISEETVIGPKLISFDSDRSSKDDINIEIVRPVSYKDAVEVLEKELLGKTLKLCNSVRKAAKILGVSHPTVIRKAKKYDLFK